MELNDFDIREVPFNRLIKLEYSDLEDYLLMLDVKEELLNHLGTFHAGVLFSMGESASGEFLLKEFRNFGKRVIPVIRQAEIKYSKPAKGRIYCTAELDEKDVSDIRRDLEQKGRSLVKVNTALYTKEGERILIAAYTWFITVMDSYS